MQITRQFTNGATQIAAKRTGETHFIDHASRSGACGDWLIKGRVEAAFTSGYSIAQDILSQL